MFTRLTLVTNLVVLGLFTGVMTGHDSRLSSPSAKTSHSSQVDQFAGRYILVRDQSADLRQAIDQATETMNFFVRRIARRQLRQKNVLYPSFVMSRSGEFFCTALAGESALSLPLSGSAITWKAPDGETVRVRLMVGPELGQVFEAKQGRRENRFTLSSGGTVLTMEVKIISQELPKPVEYRLVYRRG